MSTVTPPPPPPEERRRPFQFSMATLMWVMTGVAIAFAAFAMMPYWMGLFLLWMAQVVFTVFLVAGSLFADGATRTFCIGALATYVFNHVNAPHSFVARSPFHQMPIWQEVVNVAAYCLTALLGGWICIRARRFWENRTP